MTARASIGAGLLASSLALLAPACNKPYRVGEHVWVEWEGRDYPAYITELRGKTRYRVHFEGYDSRWDEEVTPDRVKGRIEGPVSPPPPPEKVARATGLGNKNGTDAGVIATYKIGDRVRVRWRGSIYPATVLNVVTTERFLVHYDGYESAWDEVVETERIVGTRQ